MRWVIEASEEFDRKSAFQSAEGLVSCLSVCERPCPCVAIKSFSYSFLTHQHVGVLLPSQRKQQWRLVIWHMQRRQKSIRMVGCWLASLLRSSGKLASDPWASVCKAGRHTWQATCHLLTHTSREFEVSSNEGECYRTVGGNWSEGLHSSGGETSANAT